MIEHRFDHHADNAARRHAWIDSVSDLVETHIDSDTVVPHNAFRRFYNLKQLLFSEVNGSSLRMTRARSQISAQNVDHINFFLRQSGRSHLTVNDQSHEVTPDTLAVIDIGQPTSVEADAGTTLGLVVPQRLLKVCDGNASSWHGRVVQTDSTPLYRLLADHMRNLAVCLNTATPPQQEYIAAATVALCNSALLSETDSAYNHGAVGLIAMRQFIDRHLATVDAETLMAEFGLSRTPLYKLFEAEGGVYAYIRSRRLAYAMQQLTRLDGERRPTIKHLTFACGFENEQVFSRAFRRKYGLNPSEVDVGHRPYADWTRASRLMAWFKDL
ncbi:helix-turn-helix domain-containing protein [Methylobacterium sp. 1030]|uniref:helix-turn-helix domain-containing protein n=1 Tax=Methylobacterium sp. 1030 TaxID=3156404 RepID=UPI00339A9A44